MTQVFERSNRFPCIMLYCETMKILAFTGMPCSGKSVAVQIAKQHHIPVIRMGDAVWEETKKQGLPLNDTHVGAIANDMRSKFGKDIWAKKTVEKITAMKKTDSLVIDGIRNSEEIDYFKKHLGVTLLSLLLLRQMRLARPVCWDASERMTVAMLRI